MIEQKAATLSAGDTLAWEEFERRWDAAPDLKFAELIGGKVYMPPPLSVPHAEQDSDVHFWLKHYAVKTRGTSCLINPTVRMLGDAPQPDVLLRIREEHGGRSRVRGKYLHGAPELVAETCATSAAYDLNEKKELYEQAGVEEFVALLVHEREVRWHRLDGGRYRRLGPDSAGILRSDAFPGLWLDSHALLRGDIDRVLETLGRGLASPEHLAFVQALAARSG